VTVYTDLIIYDQQGSHPCEA